MRYLILLAVFWQTLNVSAYCHTGNRTASGAWPQGGDKAAEEIRKLCIKMYKDAEAAEAAKKAADEDKRLFL